MVHNAEEMFMLHQVVLKSVVVLIIKARDEIRSRWARGNTTSPESHTAATNEEQQERVTGLTQMTPLRA